MKYFTKTKSILENFKDFITNDNIINASIGFYLATNMKTFINSLSKNIITPILNTSLLEINEKKMFTILRNGRTKTDYIDSEDAIKDKAIIINYGNFLNSSIELLISYMTLFIIIYILHKLN